MTATPKNPEYQVEIPRVVKAKITSFQDAVEAYALKGAADPKDYDQIVEERDYAWYELAKTIEAQMEKSEAVYNTVSQVNGLMYDVNNRLSLCLRNGKISKDMSSEITAKLKWAAELVKRGSAK